MPASDHTNQQKLDGLWEGWFEGGTSMPDGLALKDYLVKRFNAVDAAVVTLASAVATNKSALDAIAAKPAATVTLTDDQVAALATQVAAKLPQPPAAPAGPSASDIATEILAALKAQLNK